MQIKQLLRGRSMQLKFDDYISEQIPIDNGIGQGDPVLLPSFNYYNADLTQAKHHFMSTRIHG